MHIQPKRGSQRLLWIQQHMAFTKTCSMSNDRNNCISARLSLISLGACSSSQSPFSVLYVAHLILIEVGAAFASQLPF